MDSVTLRLLGAQVTSLRMSWCVSLTWKAGKEEQEGLGVQGFSPFTGWRRTAPWWRPDVSFCPSVNWHPQTCWGWEYCFAVSFRMHFIFPGGNHINHPTRRSSGFCCLLASLHIHTFHRPSILQWFCSEFSSPPSFFCYVFVSAQVSLLPWIAGWPHSTAGSRDVQCALPLWSPASENHNFFVFLTFSCCLS